MVKRSTKKGAKRKITKRKRVTKKKTRKGTIIRVLRGGGIMEEDLKKQFNENGVRFDGKRCLDIGTRDGFNCMTLVDFGAREVVGIDIDTSRFNEHISNSRFNELLTNATIKLKHVDFFHFEDEEKFDVITCFLWNMPIPQYDDTMKKIISLLKEGGVVYIGAVDDEYIYINKAGSVENLLRKYFNIVDTIQKSLISEGIRDLMKERRKMKPMIPSRFKGYKMIDMSDEMKDTNKHLQTIFVASNPRNL
jgi:2-polyprenyl-3-methyl-5-hydroxy-6-metoxy-1,4-benzoquinol methylase